MKNMRKALAEHQREQRGENIRRQRHELGLSQIALARLASVSEVCVRRLESGWARCQRRSVAAVQAALEAAKLKEPALVLAFNAAVARGAGRAEFEEIWTGQSPARLGTAIRRCGVEPSSAPAPAPAAVEDEKSLEPKPPLGAEERAIATLKRLAKTWPKSLWLFSASGTLCVMRVGPDGKPAMRGEGVDQRYVVDRIDIPNDGGDW